MPGHGGTGSHARSFLAGDSSGLEIHLGRRFIWQCVGQRHDGHIVASEGGPPAPEPDAGASVLPMRPVRLPPPPAPFEARPAPGRASLFHAFDNGIWNDAVRSTLAIAKSGRWIAFPWKKLLVCPFRGKCILYLCRNRIIDREFSKHRGRLPCSYAKLGLRKARHIYSINQNGTSWQWTSSPKGGKPDN